MRVLLVNEYFVPHAPGGAEWSTYYLALGLAKNGHSVRILTPDLGSGQSRYDEDEALLEAGVEILRFDFARSLPFPPRTFPSYVFGNGAFHRLFSGRIIASAGKFGADIISAQGYDSILPVFDASRSLRIPCVATLRDYRPICPISICLHHRDIAPARCTSGDFFRCLNQYHHEYDFSPGPIKLLKTLGRRYLERVNMLTTRSALKQMSGQVYVSEGIRNIYQQSRITTAKTAVVYNPRPGRFKHSQGENVILPAAPYLLFVGRYSIGKGARVLTEALPILRRSLPDVQVVVAGNREYERDAPGITFAGHLPPEKLAHYYKGAAAVLLPSRWQEPFSRVILEAAHFRRPVVATMAGGNTESISDGQSGFLVPRNDPDAFAAACEKMLRMTEEQRDQMGQALAVSLESRTDPDRAVEKLIAFFESLMEAR